MQGHVRSCVGAGLRRGDAKAKGTVRTTRLAEENDNRTLPAIVHLCYNRFEMDALSALTDRGVLRDKLIAQPIDHELLVRIAHR